jgi:hypothetical protein
MYGKIHRMNGENEIHINELVRRFVANPETFILYRGENEANQGGLHFTSDKNWAMNFGVTLLAGKLPSRCKVKLITGNDMQAAIEHGIRSEEILWEQFFSKGWDAVVGYDSENSDVLDVIVNPIHLDRFKHANN